jgi:hypothetical protein
MITPSPFKAKISECSQENTKKRLKEDKKNVNVKHT